MYNGEMCSEMSSTINIRKKSKFSKTENEDLMRHSTQTQREPTVRLMLAWSQLIICCVKSVGIRISLMDGLMLVSVISLDPE